MKQNRNIPVQVNLTADDYLFIKAKFQNLGLSDSSGFLFLAKQFGHYLGQDVNPIVVPKTRGKVPANSLHFPNRRRSRVSLLL